MIVINKMLWALEKDKKKWFMIEFVSVLKFKGFNTIQSR